MNRSDVLSLGAVATIVGLVVAGLLGAAAPPGKSGERRTRTITVAVPDPAGSPGAGVAALLARAAGQRSGGALRLRVAVAAGGTSDPDDRADEAALAAVRSGRAQLAVVPALSLRLIGVQSADPLAVPFLVDTDALASRIVADRHLVQRLQAGLPAAGLGGLGLIAEGLYRPIGYLKPIETPADFRGLEIRTPQSEALRSVLRALGARPVSMDAAGIESAVLAGFGEGEPVARDSSFPADAYGAVNLALLPKIDVVVASAAALRPLPADLQGDLRAAVSDVRQEVSEPEGIRAFCRAGGTVVAAPPGAGAKLRAVLRAPADDDAITPIERLAATVSAAGCNPGTLPIAQPRFDRLPRAARNRLLVPDGIYRHVFPPSTRTDTGVATLTVTGETTRGYRFFELDWQGRPAATCRGRIGVVGGRDVLRWNPLTPCSDRVTFGWRDEQGDVDVVVDASRSDAGFADAFAGLWKTAYPVSPGTSASGA